MKSNIHSIAEPSDVKGLLIQAISSIDKNPNKVVAAHIVLIDDKGQMWSDACGVEAQTVVWSMLKEVLRILEDD